MDNTRRRVVQGLAALAMFPGLAQAAETPPPAAQVIHDWYRLMLELVRHTPTMSPPVSSRAMAYIGVVTWEALAAPGTRSLAGQLNGLSATPPRPAGLDDAAVLHGALAFAFADCFANTGPTGQRALRAMTARVGDAIAAHLAPDIAAASIAQGETVARHVLAWAATDGGAVIENMGFPYEFTKSDDPARWVPTTILVRQQQAPLLPQWGENRPLAMKGACGLPPPPAYSEEPGSAFYTEALEVYEAVKNLTPDQRLIARFWSDDPMLSPTPPGHWISIAMGCLQVEDAPADRRAEVLARLGIAVSDAFIACWQAKYLYDLVRPVTYIRKVIDKTWEPLLITPPFPEYPSGHSSQSGAAADVLTALYGPDQAFTDTTHAADGLPGRDFPNFWAAAEEAGISRLYGGIHFRAAIEQGLEQGRCVAAHVTRLEMRA